MRWAWSPSRTFQLLLALFLLFGAGANVKAQCSLTLADPAGGFPAAAQAQDAIKVAFTVLAPCDTPGKVRVQVSAPVGAVISDEIRELSATHNYELTINLFEGQNTVTILGLNPTAVPPLKLQPAATWTITCNGRWCNQPLSRSPTSIAGLVGAPLVAAPGAALPAATAKVTINQPASTVTVGSSVVDLYLTVDNSVAKLRYDIYKDGDTIFTSEEFTGASVAGRPLPVQIVKGSNLIRFIDVTRPGEILASREIICDGDKCASDFLASTVTTNSQNTRVLVGLEQAGGSSTESTTKPFFDLHLTVPFLFDRQSQEDKDKHYLKVPRIATWGQIRLAATPEQLTNISVLPSNLVNQLVQTDKINNMVQSFDFLAGLEVRLFTARGAFQGLVPGVRQRTRFYVAGGYGAISPLSVETENVRFFKVPGKESSQYPTFIERYGTPKDNQTNVAFVPLDRDRFLRQWYIGLRTKTYYCDDEDCTRFKNRFPGILDVMYGQSEAVTGGSRKYEISNSNGTARSENAYVLRIDGFYPLPFRDASFLFLYGTAIMKVGGLGTNISNPLILDPVLAPVPSINDSTVFIPSLDRLIRQQPNRDYYKFGIGINLTDFFNRNRTRPQ